MPDNAFAADAAMKIETLAGGMRALMAPSDMNNIVALSCYIPLPGAIERPGEAGLVSFTHRMLMRGTSSLGPAELATAIASLGASVGCDAEQDFSCAHMVCTSDTFAETLRLLADILQNPSFEPEEIEKERQSTIAAIRRCDDDKPAFAIKRFMRELYGGHSYGLPRMGVKETVSEFRRDQAAGIHEEFFDPARFLVVCAGNFHPGEARAMLESLFLPRQTRYEPVEIPAPAYAQPYAVQLRRECEQAFLVAGYPACSIQSFDYPAVRVLRGVLGESMSSRFFVELRDKRGLAYATGCSGGAYLHGGHLAGYIGTKPESLAEAREGMMAEFDRIRREPPAADELDRARNHIIGKFLIDHQTNAQRTGYLGDYEMLGLGFAYDEKYPALIGGVSAGDVLDAARKYITEPVMVELVPGKEASDDAMME
ncbi:MAG: pitrilysin family protein [bacterium]|nr:pitrilysin family protein [Candidatus Sumerlaeota bacterium]